MRARSLLLLRDTAQGADLRRHGLEIRQRNESQEKALPQRGPVDTGEMDRQGRARSPRKSPGTDNEVDRRKGAEIVRGIDGAMDRRTARGGIDL